MCHSPPLRKGLRVLVIDESADSRNLLAALFDAYEVETTTATCVSEALERLQQEAPDLLISEIFLPGEDGYSLIGKVKAFEARYRVRIPTIALTACASKRDQFQAIAAGFCQHLAKPLDIDALIATVAYLTGQTSAMAAFACP